MEERINLVTDTTTPSTTLMQTPTRVQSKCKICGADAIYSYLGVMACFPCKMFFKRNAENKQAHFKCYFDGHCEVNIHNRHICPFCRLKKCFASGMRPELFRGPGLNKNKTNRKKKAMVKSVTTTSTALMKVVARDRSQQLPTLNLLQSDQSTLSVDQWNLLSNLMHCYDEYSGFSMAERYIREQNALPFKIRYKFSSGSELFALLMTGAQQLFEKNFDFLSLSLQDCSLLLHGKFKYVGGLCACFILSRIGLFDNPMFYQTAEATFGSATVSSSKLTGDQLDSDIVFMKLALSILVFSTFDYTFYTNTAPINLKNIKTVLRIQDMYVELAWRYLIYKYDHSHAVICFSNLIRCIFTVNNATVEAIKIKQYTDIADVIIKQTEQTLSLND